MHSKEVDELLLALVQGPATRKEMKKRRGLGVEISPAGVAEAMGRGYIRASGVDRATARNIYALARPGMDYLDSSQSAQPGFGGFLTTLEEGEVRPGACTY